MEFHHTTVLLHEMIDSVLTNPHGVYVDCTLGGGGHSMALSERLEEDALVIGVDQDQEAIDAASERLKGTGCRHLFVRDNFSHISSILDSLDIEKVDGFIIDLGVSSHQLDTEERGFSYHTDAPLDMRMSQSGMSAADVVNTWSQEELTRILFAYGEESFARAIARNICQARQEQPITTTLQLAEIVKSSVPQRVRRAKNPCKQTFQAIRIAVNDEFGHLERALTAAFSCLKPGGRLAIITFHSLEDRMVKQQFAKWCQGCTCPPDFPKCVCGKVPQGKLVNRKPIVADAAELEENRRSRSAKLRVIERSAAIDECNR